MSLNIKGKEYDFGCFCNSFTSLKDEFIPAYDLIYSEKKPNHISLIDHFINLAVKHGINEDQLRYDLDMMFLCDYVISGFDRHLNNFGILRDPETLRFKRLAPVFDSGGALFAGKELPTKKSGLLNIKVNSFVTKEAKMLPYIRNKSVLNINKLPSSEWVRDLYSKDSQQSERRINAVVKVYTQKITLLEEIQKGRDPYKKEPELSL